MNTLLVWPRIPFSYWGAQYSVKLIGTRSVMPPLGLLTLAALCPKDLSLRLVDVKIEELDDADLEWPDLVMVSGMAIQHDSMVQVLTRAKAKGIPTVVGGPHATSSPERLDLATHLVLDEGEITLPQFFADYEN